MIFVMQSLSVQDILRLGNEHGKFSRQEEVSYDTSNTFVIKGGKMFHMMSRLGVIIRHVLKSKKMLVVYIMTFLTILCQNVISKYI